MTSQQTSQRARPVALRRAGVVFVADVIVNAAAAGAYVLSGQDFLGMPVASVLVAMVAVRAFLMIKIWDGSPAARGLLQTVGVGCIPMIGGVAFASWGFAAASRTAPDTTLIALTGAGAVLAVLSVIFVLPHSVRQWCGPQQAAIPLVTDGVRSRTGNG